MRRSLKFRIDEKSVKKMEELVNNGRTGRVGKRERREERSCKALCIEEEFLFTLASAMRIGSPEKSVHIEV